MYPAPINRVLADEEKLLIFGVERATDDGVIVGLDILVVFILEEALVDNLFWHFPLVDQHVASAVVHPNAIRAEGLLVV